jgi:2-dehydro-3-deoxyphosphogluconate aldolase/(4S)-4-hydroxy-2-oxoglutarate aldolase
MAHTDIRDRLIAQRVVPVLRLASAELTERAVGCLAEAGFTTFEITLTTPGAPDLIRQLAGNLGPDILIGAGTLLDTKTAQQCVDAGARFLVSPCLVPGLARTAHAAGCAAMVGAFTPSEILAAHRDGADVVKVFPANLGGPDYLRSIRAVFPDIRLCPSGGVTAGNVEIFLTAGAALVCAGSNIIDHAALAADDRSGVIAHARRFLYPGPAAA